MIITRVCLLALAEPPPRHSIVVSDSDLYFLNSIGQLEGKRIGIGGKVQLQKGQDSKICSNNLQVSIFS